ncbi:nuclear transport factor 2 family protein [Amycolatopsis sp. lyj-90]|uniref:nuclear transport factor 2 family protein n=1 Tax=Amycolatopsis sp. lyj-90 TaxID=2789285 RepID=UPI003979D251
MTRTTDAALAALMRFYAAESRYLEEGAGDFSEIAETLDPGCVIYQPASLPYGGEWRGHAGFEAWMVAFGDAWSSLEVRNPEFVVQEEVVVSRSHVHAVARRTNVAVDWPLLQHFRIRNGKIKELRPFYWDTALVVEALR